MYIIGKQYQLPAVLFSFDFGWVYVRVLESTEKLCRYVYEEAKQKATVRIGMFFGQQLLVDCWVQILKRKTGTKINYLIQMHVPN